MDHIFSKTYLFLLYVYGRFAYMYVCILFMSGTLGARREHGSLGLVVGCWELTWALWESARNS